MRSRTEDSALSLAWTFGVAADNLDSVGVYLVRVVQLEIDILDNESPDVVAEAVSIEVSLQVDLQPSTLQFQTNAKPTLNVSRLLTFSERTSATALSKLARIFMASCGSMRRSVMRLSSVSVRAPPRLTRSAV